MGKKVRKQINRERKRKEKKEKRKMKEMRRKRKIKEKEEDLFLILRIVAFFKGIARGWFACVVAEASPDQKKDKKFEIILQRFTFPNCLSLSLSTQLFYYIT